MTTVVKTYRVLKDGMKVGNSVRLYNDLIPEAAEWPNKDVYLRAGHIEVVYLSEEEVAAREETRIKRGNSESETTSPVSETEKKPKAVKKKVVKRGKNGSGRNDHASGDDGSTGSEGISGDNGADSDSGRQLAEQSV